MPRPWFFVVPILISLEASIAAPKIGWPTMDGEISVSHHVVVNAETTLQDGKLRACDVTMFRTNSPYASNCRRSVTVNGPAKQTATFDCNCNPKHNPTYFRTRCRYTNGMAYYDEVAATCVADR